MGKGEKLMLPKREAQRQKQLHALIERHQGMVLDVATRLACARLQGGATVNVQLVTTQAEELINGALDSLPRGVKRADD